MHNRNEFCNILCRRTYSHGNTNKVTSIKDFITYFLEISNLVIINANYYHSTIRKKIFYNFKPWINHI